ncbi:unnamed protein product, partial [Staurois parvus]
KQSFLLLSGCILAAIEKYCVSCDWSQLVTWYKAVVNRLYHVTSVIIHRFHKL